MRLPTGQFLNAMLSVMKDWSLDRTSHLPNSDGQLVPNPNLKTFKTHPAISNEDYLAAYNWNKLDKQIRFVRSADVYMVKAHKPNTESELNLSQEECTSYFRAVRDLDFQSLDSLLDTVHSIHTIKINVDDWSMSECTCSFWLKNYKCSHVIATAFRLNLVSWDPIFLDLPLAKKNKRGARKKTMPALVRQSIETPRTAPKLIEESSEDEEELLAVAVPTKKRGRPPKDVQTKRTKKNI